MKSLITVLALTITLAACGKDTEKDKEKEAKGVEVQAISVDDTPMLKDNYVTISAKLGGSQQESIWDITVAMVEGETAPDNCVLSDNPDADVRTDYALVTFDGLTPDTTYSFRVCGYDSSINYLTKGVTKTFTTKPLDKY